MGKIEFIGASGVGKTTLYNKLLLSYDQGRWWQTPGEARITMAKSMVKDLKGINEVFWLFLHFNLFPKNHNRFALRILNDHIEKNMKKELYKYNELISIMLNTLIGEEDKESYQKAEFIVFYMNLLKYDILPFQESKEDTFIVYDDGIIHNTSGLAHEKNFKAMKESSQDVIKGIFPQGVVFCELNMDDNIERRRQRMANGKGICFEGQINSDKLMEISRKSIENSYKKIELMEKYNIPVLRINMADPPEKNTHLIHTFINGYK